MGKNNHDKKKNQLLGHFSELYIYKKNIRSKIERISNTKLKFVFFFYIVIFAYLQSQFE